MSMSGNQEEKEPDQGATSGEHGGGDGTNADADEREKELEVAPLPPAPPSPQPPPLLRSKRGRPKGSKSGSLPNWRIALLREAGRVRGQQLKADPAHQSKAGKARASQTDMKKLAAEGNARAVELDPQHQARAGRGNRGKPRGKRTKKPPSQSKDHQPPEVQEHGSE